MSTLLNISNVFLTAGEDVGRVFDMTGRCAFAICENGDFDIRISNVEYKIKGRCIFACMPFVNVEIIRINETSKLILGGIKLEDVLSVINTTVNSNNLLAIHQNPLVNITDSQFDYLATSIKEYQEEISESLQDIDKNNCLHIQQEIIRYHSGLIVAKVMKVFFSNMPMLVDSCSHRDAVFQLFMLDLQTNCRTQRNVDFYASRSSLSRKYFSTIVRQVSGQSPSDLIKTVVIGEAKAMLNDKQKSIKAIASSLNFPDSPTFTKYFRRATGMSPKTYRKSLP